MTHESTSIKPSPFFDLLDRSDFLEGDCWHSQKYETNAVILKEGEYTGRVYLILEGNVRVIGNVTMNGNYHVRPGVNELGAGDTFGEFSLLDQEVHSATVQAVSPCRMAVIDNQRLIEYLDAHQAIGYAIYRQIALSLTKRMRIANSKILSLLAWGFKVHGIDKYMKND